jgi:hypothetical protein
MTVERGKKEKGRKKERERERGGGLSFLTMIHFDR